MLVPALKTPITSKQAADILLVAWPKVSEKPSREQALLTLAHVWLETNAGKGMVQYNWGNISTRDNGSNEYWHPPWYTVGPESTERMKYLNAEMLKGKAPSAFRAYPNHELGAMAYLATVKGKPELWNAGKTGDPLTFATAIYDTKYSIRGMDGQNESTANSLQSLVNQLESEGLFSELRPLVNYKPVKRRVYYYPSGYSRRRSGILEGSESDE